MRREEILPDLRTNEPFDMLVIGGGATGSGVALDAASRGLRVAYGSARQPSVGGIAILASKRAGRRQD